MRIYCLLSILSLFCGISFAGGISDRLSSAVRERGPVAVLFEQSKESDMFEVPIKSRGFILADSSGNFRWQIETPYKSVAIYFGGRFYQFEFLGNEVRRLNSAASESVSDIAGKICGIALGNISETDFEISQNLSELSLKPKGGSMGKFVRDIKVSLKPDGKSISSVEIRGADGDVMRVSILKVLPWKGGSDGAFDISKVAEYKFPGE